MRMTDKNSTGAGRGVALVLILIELFGAFFFGMTVLDSYGPDSLISVKFSAIGAGIAGVLAYIILHMIPGIRWLMMVAMVLLWGFVAYYISLIVIGDAQAGFKLVAHKGPYVAAAIAALFRAIMYR